MTSNCCRHLTNTGNRRTTLNCSPNTQASDEQVDIAEYCRQFANTKPVMGENDYMRTTETLYHQIQCFISCKLPDALSGSRHYYSEKISCGPCVLGVVVFLGFLLFGEIFANCLGIISEYDRWFVHRLPRYLANNLVLFVNCPCSRTAYNTFG